MRRTDTDLNPIVDEHLDLISASLDTSILRHAVLIAVMQGYLAGYSRAQEEARVAIDESFGDQRDE